MIDTSPNLVLVLTIVVLVAAGVYLLLERSLTRVLIGLIMISNAINLLFLVAGGAAGGPPIIGVTPESEMSDPLPQAMVLTAIVITLGMSAFLVTIAYRSWQLHRHDEVQDDLEDRRVALRAAEDRATFEDLDATGDATLDQTAAEVHDETVHEEALQEEALREKTRRGAASAASWGTPRGARRGPPRDAPPGEGGGQDG